MSIRNVPEKEYEKHKLISGTARKGGLENITQSADF
jgi:hypothetical protein